MMYNVTRIIQSTTRESPSPAHLRELIALCRAIAVVHLKKKITAGRFRADLFSSSLQDLAIDCIADLFQTDRHGNLIQIQAYFEGMNVEGLSEEKLLICLRRLVCGRVNQSIFRLYSEWDPSLAKILRNIKITINSLQQFTMVERFGEIYVAPALCETLESLPPFDLAELEHHMRGDDATRGTKNVPLFLAAFSRVLRSQSERSRLVPLISVGVLFRSFYSQQIDTAVEGLVMADRFLPAEILSIIQEECWKVRQQMEQQYVFKKKVSPVVFEHYFTVIHRHLCETLTETKDEPLSFYHALQLLMPDLTRETYSKIHQAKLEYLARLTKERTIAQLRKFYA